MGNGYQIDMEDEVDEEADHNCAHKRSDSYAFL